MKNGTKVSLIFAAVLVIGVVVLCGLFANITYLSQANSPMLGLLIGVVVALPCIVLGIWLCEKYVRH